MKSLWINHEKLRSDLFKYLGFVMCTPFAAIVLDQFIHGLKFDVDLLIRLLFSLFLVYGGMLAIAYSVEIMYKLDRRLECDKRS